MRAPPRTLRRRADRRSGCSGQRASTSPRRGSKDGQRTRRSGPTRGPQARAPARHDPSIARAQRAHRLSKPLSVIVPVVPPSPVRPENGTTATVAPRRSSSSHTAWRAASSRRPGRSRAACGWEASRPDGVWHGSPGSALQVGHERSRQPRATCILCRRTRALPRRIPICSAARARRRPAVRTPLIQPCSAIAHPVSCPRARARSRLSEARDRQPGPPPSAPTRGGFSVQVGRCLLNWASRRRFPDLLAQTTPSACRPRKDQNGRTLQGFSDVARPGLEPGDTTILSRVV